jgi:dihydrofolate reductase
MGKVTYDISMSLDGFVSGANVRLEAGLGDGGERLHEWGFNSTDPRNREIVAGWVNTGAIITGRKTYDLSIQYWGADGPIQSTRVPVIVLSHSVPNNVPAGGVYTFVDSVEAAHLVPVLFGSGVRLFESPGSEHVPLEIVKAIETAEAVHLRFRVVK